MDASSTQLNTTSDRDRGVPTLNSRHLPKAAKTVVDDPLTPPTSAPSGKAGDYRETRVPQPVKDVEAAHGDAFCMALAEYKDSREERMCYCLERSHGGGVGHRGVQRGVHSNADPHTDLDASLSQTAEDELVEFIATELEQQHARISALSNGLARLERAVAASSCDMATLKRERHEKSGQQLAFMRRLETEVVRGAGLRSEEARLRDAKLEKSLRAIRRNVEGTLKTFERAQEARLLEMEEKVDKMVVDVVVENQTLKAENMELRVALQQVAAAASSNKKTLRVLTDEILKLKRQLACSTSSDGPGSASGRLERGIAMAFRVASADPAAER